MKKLLICALTLFLVSPVFAKSKSQDVVRKLNKKGTNEVIKHDHIDLTKKKVLLLNGRVDQWKMKDLAKQLKGNDEVHLVINSPGGSVAAGIHFINEVEALRNQGELKLYCYIQDMAASMAAVISSYCDGVLIHKFGFFMIHEASYGCSGSQSQVKECVKFSENWLMQVEKDTAENYGVSLKEFIKFQGAERFMGVDETVGYGFAEGSYESLMHNGYEPKKPKSSFGFLFGGEGDDLEYKLDKTDVDYMCTSRP